MKSAAIGLVSAALFLVLTSFAVTALGSPRALRTGPITLAELPLNRGFQAYGEGATQLFTIPGENPTYGVRLQFPPTSGAAISQITPAWGFPGSDRITVRVDNQIVTRRINLAASGAGSSSVDFSPPIVVAPGSVLEIGASTSSAQVIGFSLGGWTLVPGDV